MSFKKLHDDAKKSDQYWSAKAIIEFTSDLESLMEKKGISRKDFSKLVGTSQAYITRVLSGEANFTIDSMVRLTRALDGCLHIHVSDKNHEVQWLDLVSSKNNVLSSVIRMSSAEEIGVFEDDVSSEIVGVDDEYSSAAA